jgi:UDP-N-acetylmuramoylalanine-D-glutamate ligase
MEDVEDMAEKKVWLVTGAGRGIGIDIAKAALAAGYTVVATGRDPEKVTQAVGESGDLLTVQLDVTDPADAEAAVQAAMERFGRIDVLVQQRRQLLRRVLRGDQPGGLPGAGRDQLVRPAQRHTRGAAGHA